MWLAPAANPSPLDVTAPSISYKITGISGTNGWYRGSSGGEYVVLHWALSDPTSQIASTSGCELAVRVDGPTKGTTKTCTATLIDNSQISVTTSPIKVDNEPPTGVDANARVPDHGSWYNQPVDITWNGSDATSGINSCTTLSYSGPDSGSASPSGACTDNAGNVSGTVTYLLKYDATPPTVTATPDRQPNAYGWYKDPVKVTWSGSDATSGIAAGSCTAAVTYSGPDTGGATRSGTCSDQAGNSASASVLLRYDTTAPSATATPDHQPNANGWYKDPVKVTWSGSDATSGVAPGDCTAPVTYSGPDSGGTSRSGTCTDRAGNQSASTSFGLKYDATAPVLSPTADRGPNANGWYRSPVTISWNGSDNLSGLASCPSSVTYNGPDSGSAAPSATCTDQAGNSASTSFPLKYDATPPVASAAAPARPPDVGGWYNHQVAINWSGSDATSGPVSCTSLLYGGPDGANVAPSGTCTDQAGNTSAPLTLPAAIQFDATPPTAVQAVPARGPDHNGWYNQPVAIDWSGADATSGIAGCTSLKYSGPDSASAAPSGACTDKAGNSTAVAFPLQYDATAPVVSASPTRVPDSNGWYNHAVTVGWAGSDSASGVESCTDPSTYAGPDSAGVSFGGACTDKAGNSSSSSFELSYDATPPAVSARAERGPDHNGWYNRPVKIDFVGTDALSGVDSCTSMTYSGPFIKSIKPVGGCRDRAGNSGFASVPIDYDSDPPKLSRVAVESRADADVVSWKSSSSDDIATVSRTPRGGRSATIFHASGATFVDKGIKPGLEYRYSIQTSDQAGNESKRLSRLALPKVLTLQNRGYLPHTAGAPVLRLPTVAGVRYYHVQLFRQGVRIYAAWPLAPQLALRTSWKWAGRSYKLTPGRYRWFAWAGFGRRSAARYKLLGSAYFIVGRL
jgi:hypothetical protein